MTTLIVHRATHEIGGNCIEIRARSGERLVLDVGRPLDAPEGATNLLPTSLDKHAPATVLISHPHVDHYGLLGELPRAWPIWCGEATRLLIEASVGLSGKRLDRSFAHWRPGTSFTIGPFIITPFLTDHSAFDAHMLLIEIDGRRIMYSGDFRRHGRKAGLVDRLAGDLPKIDVLLLEGTNLGRDKPVQSEADLEENFATLFKETRARVFIAWSPQNVDRTVSIYRACLKSGRTLVLDLYSAEIMEMLKPFARIPQPGWSNLKVVITKRLARRYRALGKGALVDRYAENGISARALGSTPDRWVTMIRSSLIDDYEAASVSPTAEDGWSWSLWRGYLERPDSRRLIDWFDGGGAAAVHIHSSGHATRSDLRWFAQQVNPRWMVPIHGVAWDGEAKGWPPVMRLNDGEPFELE